MPKAFHPSVVTANDLRSGDVVYLTDQDTWTDDLSQAVLLEDEADAQLRLIEAGAQTQTVVGVYLAPMQATDSGPAPVHFREAFRRRGPSNYPHGKQETQNVPL